MTKAEAKANQDRIAHQYSLGWWYGIRCKKCCDVYPKFMKTKDLLECFYECEVCHKRTAPAKMPWIAEEAWNNGEFVGGQMDIFSYLDGGKT